MPVCVTKIEKELRTFLRGAELAAKGVSNGWWARVCQQGPLCISQANRRFFPAIEEIRITRSSTELSCSCSLGTAGKIFHVAVASTDLHLKLEQYCKGSLWYIDQRDLGFKNLNAVLVLRLFGSCT